MISTNNGVRVMMVGLLDGGEVGENNGVSFVEIS